MKGYIKAETLLIKLKQMRSILEDALEYDESIIDDYLMSARVGSVKTLDDVIKLVEKLEKEDKVCRRLQPSRLLKPYTLGSR